MTTELLITLGHAHKPVSVILAVTSPYSTIIDHEVAIHFLGYGEKDNLGSSVNAPLYKGDLIENNTINNCNIREIPTKQFYSLMSDDPDTYSNSKGNHTLTQLNRERSYCTEQFRTLSIPHRLIGYTHQTIFVATTHPTPSEVINMITLSKFYLLVRKRLDLRRFPKSKVKSTGLAQYPAKGNYRKWYYGVMHTSTEGKEKVSLIPYLSGDSVPLDYTRQSSEVKETNEGVNTQAKGENVDDVHIINIGTIEDVFAFTFPMPNVTHLPIMIAGDDEFYLPVEYMGMVEALQKIIDHRKSINPNFSKYYAYISVDNSVSSHSLSDLTSESEHTTIEKFHIYYGEDYRVFVTSTELPYLTVTFTTDKLNTIGYGINPLLPEKWTYQPMSEVT